MKIEEGKSYKTRDGRKASKPEWNSDHGCWYLVVDEASEDNRTLRAYESDGTHGSEGVCNDPNLDLVAEWSSDPAGPVVVETRKRIVPGKHDNLTVKANSSTQVVLTIDELWYGREEIRRLIGQLESIDAFLADGAR